MADHPSWIEIVSNQFETKFGGWQQPDAMDPCRVGLGGCPVQWTEDYELRKLEVHWSRTPTTGVVQDHDICTFHMLNLTAGDPDATWTTADYTLAETKFLTFWDDLRTLYTAEVKLAEFVWRADGPAFKPFGTDLSPTLRITPESVAGLATGTNQLPPQVAMSVTEVVPAHYTAFGVGVPGKVPGTGRTQVRNRWGRFYLPAPVVGSVISGRFSNSATGQVATAVQSLYNALVLADLIPVMYSPTTGAAWSLDAIHVDDIADVIRSRRYVTPLTRNVKTIDAP